MTDFGADGAFVGDAAKLKEHYGIEVPVSAIRWFTEEDGDVADGKFKKDDRSTGLTSQRRLGGLLEQRASASGITDSHF
jgi:hypothetical protein